LARFEDNKRLNDVKLICDFKIKVTNSYETVNSFYMILKCYDLENDVEKETNFSNKVSNKIIDRTTLVNIFRDKSETNNNCIYLETFDGSRFSLFLNNPNESKRLEKIGIQLKDYWPIDDELEQILIKSIEDIPLRVLYNERERSNNITCKEYINDENENFSKILTI
jgi:isocitrate dehydrogenase kinase/phosphatase